MIPAPFEYHRPSILQEAFSLAQEYGEDGKYVSGGHSLIPKILISM